MIDQLANLNWLSVLAAFVPYFLLGSFVVHIAFQQAVQDYSRKKG